MAITFEQACRTILDNLSALDREECLLDDCYGRALAQAVTAPRDMPLWHNSAMDGYALRSGDCAGGDTSLKINGCVLAGDAPGVELESGCALRIMTGAPVPTGADTIIPFEEAQLGEGVLLVQQPIKPGNHVRLRGEDVAAGDTVLSAGTRLRPQEIGMLASLGFDRVSVHHRPRVAILSTGDELVAPGQALQPGQISDGNSAAMAAALREAGAVPISLGICKDNQDALLRALSALPQIDALITSAGISAGERDLVRPVLEELGWQELFWKVKVKPGYPTAFGLLDEKPVFCLPGNPVSALMIFEQMVRPALLKMSGHQEVMPPMLKAVIKDDITKKPGRLGLIRVCVSFEEGRLVACSAGVQQSGVLSTSLRANGVAYLLEESCGVEVGDVVEVRVMDEFV
ncbi:MAG: molybdopterin molybdotransferase MoeA [Desulfuromonadales bacterium]|nr:molybdopterin molybdotransferase MoeA [Desulfuromonadales bacterium]